MYKSDFFLYEWTVKLNMDKHLVKNGADLESQLIFLIIFKFGIVV